KWTQTQFKSLLRLGLRVPSHPCAAPKLLHKSRNGLSIRLTAEQPIQSELAGIGANRRNSASCGPLHMFSRSHKFIWTTRSQIRSRFAFGRITARSKATSLLRRSRSHPRAENIL